MERHSAYPMAAAMGKLIWLAYVVKGLASLDPFLGAPAVSGAGERYRGSRVLSTVHCHAPVYRGFWKYVFPWWQLARFTLGIWCNISFSSVYLAVVVPRLGVACGVQNWIFREILGLLLCNTWFDSGYMFCDSLRRYWNELHTFSSLPWTRNLRSSVSVLSQNGDMCSVDASVRSPVTLLALGIWTPLSWNSRGCRDHA